MNMNLTGGLSKTRYKALFKPHHVEILKYLKARLMGATGSEVWHRLATYVEGSISRASVINSLNTLVDLGLLSYKVRTGKIGYQRVYYRKHGETELNPYLETPRDMVSIIGGSISDSLFGGGLLWLKIVGDSKKVGPQRTM